MLEKVPFASDAECVQPLLAMLGVTLDTDQLHTGGERFLMSPNKLVLTGTTDDGRRVIVKVSDSPEGKAEIRREELVRSRINELPFSLRTVRIPASLFFGEKEGYLIAISEFIEQEKVLLAHQTTDAFFMLLKALEEQEGFHAATREHLDGARDLFETYDTGRYVRDANRYAAQIAESLGASTAAARTARDAAAFLAAHRAIFDRYARHLVHTDFAPHNVRIKGREIYTLDLSSIRLAHKYEAWARLINYFIIHEPKLERLLSEYIRNNRSEDEFLALRVIRVFKVLYLLAYYVRSLPKTTGDLHTLTEERIALWERVLAALVADTELPREYIEQYRKRRSALRSEEEKRRQREFAIA